MKGIKLDCSKQLPYIKHSWGKPTFLTFSNFGECQETVLVVCTTSGIKLINNDTGQIVFQRIFTGPEEQYSCVSANRSGTTLIAEKRAGDGKDYLLLSNTGDFIQRIGHVSLPDVKFPRVSITIHFDLSDTYIYLIKTDQDEKSTIDVFKQNTDGEKYSFITTIRDLEPTVYISLIRKIIVFENGGVHQIRSLDIDIGDDKRHYPDPGTRYVHVQDDDGSIVDLDRKQICCQTEPSSEKEIITILPVKTTTRPAAEGEVFTLTMKSRLFCFHETPVYIHRLEEKSEEGIFDEEPSIEATAYLLCYDIVTLAAVRGEKIAISNNISDTLSSFDVAESYVPRWIIKTGEKTITCPVSNSLGTFAIVGGKQIIDLTTSEIVFKHKQEISEFEFNSSGTVLFILVPLSSGMFGSRTTIDRSKSIQRRTRLEVYKREIGSSRSRWYLYDDHTINSSAMNMTAADSLMVFTGIKFLLSMDLMTYDVRRKRVMYAKELNQYLHHKMFNYIHLIIDNLLSISIGEQTLRFEIDSHALPKPAIKTNEIHFDWPENYHDWVSVKPAESRSGRFLASAEVEPNRLKIRDDKRCLYNFSETCPVFGEYFSSCSAGAIVFMTFTFKEHYLLVLYEQPDFHFDVLVIPMNLQNQRKTMHCIRLNERKHNASERYALIGSSTSEAEFIVYRVMPPAKSARVYSIHAKFSVREIIFTDKEKGYVGR